MKSGSVWLASALHSKKKNKTWISLKHNSVAFPCSVIQEIVSYFQKGHSMFRESKTKYYLVHCAYESYLVAYRTLILLCSKIYIVNQTHRKRKRKCYLRALRTLNIHQSKMITCSIECYFWCSRRVYLNFQNIMRPNCICVELNLF